MSGSAGPGTQGRSADVVRYTIQHQTTFSYSRPVQLQRHRPMLPRSSDVLHILGSSPACVPEAQVGWSQDVFGNLIATADLQDRQPAS